MQNEKEIHVLVERFFLERIRNQLKYIPLTEALDFKDRKEIQQLIRKDLGSRAFRKEIDKAFKQDFDAALRAAFGINNRGRVGDYVVNQAKAAVESEISSGAARKFIADVCKEVIAKLNREMALRYAFIVKNLKL
jgi:hypothetical protein